MALLRQCCLIDVVLSFLVANSLQKLYIHFLPILPCRNTSRWPVGMGISHLTHQQCGHYGALGQTDTKLSTTGVIVGVIVTDELQRALL